MSKIYKEDKILAKSKHKYCNITVMWYTYLDRAVDHILKMTLVDSRLTAAALTAL
jgi:hypothetical protein